jgi:hypothetical protein
MPIRLTRYSVNQDDLPDGFLGSDRMSTVSYLDRFLEPVTEVFTPALARKLADLRADARVASHIEELRRKADEGTLTPDEEAQYKDFVEASDVIAILQAKARRYLASHAR